MEVTYICYKEYKSKELLIVFKILEMVYLSLHSATPKYIFP